MPNFRIYYVARRPHGIQLDSEYTRSMEEPRGLLRHGEMNWEEDIEARNPREALRIFFEEHLERQSDLAYIDEEGRTQRPHRFDDFDPDRTYVWTEDDRLMEFQGIENLEGGLVPCPLCGGSGEVTPEVAKEFEEIEEEGEEYYR
ncbi:MAG: hypothetical protein AMJ77_05125 [Dehalococcoidia bacterium SM23_28_2]|nr:MAG: hypothetical protein AMJ77_05125 [Dehalococcoidia bacterium SM23_28_2]